MEKKVDENWSLSGLLMAGQTSTPEMLVDKLGLSLRSEVGNIGDFEVMEGSWESSC